MYTRILSLLTALLLTALALGACAATPGDSNMADTAGSKTVPIASVRNVVDVAGGSFSTPYQCTSPDTEYRLTGDVTAAGTAFEIRATRVTLNLNGHTVTYNNASPGYGVDIAVYNTSDIIIANGSIIQGAAASEGDQVGKGNNAITSRGTTRLEIAGINAVVRGRDVSAFYLSVTNANIHDNTIEDLYNNGTLKNRHQGIAMIVTGGDSQTIHHNRIINTRQIGIDAVSNSDIYSNHITINSIATNSYGVRIYAKQNVNVFNNVVIGRGEHPLGVGAVSSGINNVHVYSNYFDMQTTRIGVEYAGGGGNYAVGFRTTWGAQNLEVDNNTIVITCDSAYAGTDWLGNPVTVHGRGRGFMVGHYGVDDVGHYHDNHITVLNTDGIAAAEGIAVTGNNVSTNMLFERNTVVSNWSNVVLGDDYGYADGYPLFINNTFVKADNYPNYSTIRSAYSGVTGTGILVSNTYTNGASKENPDMIFEASSKKEVIFGEEVELTVAQNASSTESALLTINDAGNNISADISAIYSGQAVSGATVSIEDNTGSVVSTAATDAQGKAALHYLHTKISNVSGSVAGGTTTTLTPARVTVNIGGAMYSTDPSQTDWHQESTQATNMVELYQFDGTNIGAPSSYSLTINKP